MGQPSHAVGRAPAWIALAPAAESMTRKRLVQNFTNRLRGNAITCRGQYVKRMILVPSMKVYLHYLRPGRDSNAGPTAQEFTS
jgi:hypothetical protein